MDRRYTVLVRAVPSTGGLEGLNNLHGEGRDTVARKATPDGCIDGRRRSQISFSACGSFPPSHRFSSALRTSRDFFQLLQSSLTAESCADKGHLRRGGVPGLAWGWSCAAARCRGRFPFLSATSSIASPPPLSSSLTTPTWPWHELREGGKRAKDAVKQRRNQRWEGHGTSHSAISEVKPAEKWATGWLQGQLEVRAKLSIVSLDQH